jgi:2-polyprenyl-3-methyl-5-hydroxy-6-metoxy-1,4-benzoquinol methylase
MLEETGPSGPVSFFRDAGVREDCQNRVMGRLDVARAMSFDGAASSYDRFRPRYPREFFDDLADVVGLSSDSRILEVGCGPGVATEEMMDRGWSVLAVEPGERLARVAREKFDDERFAVEISTFDDWDAHGRHFDLLFSASAYHWVAPALRWVKAADVLVEGGHIALVTHEVDEQGTFHDFVVQTRELRMSYGDVDELESATVDHVRSMIESSGGDIGALWEALSMQGTDALAGELFAAPDVRSYRWSTAYSTQEALGLLATYSLFLVMDPTRRAELFDRLAAIIDRDYGGRLTRYYVTVSAVAARRAT